VTRSGGSARRNGEEDMTITSRGAVAPTSDQAATGNGAPAPATAAPLDSAALEVAVIAVADHAHTWAAAGADARADLLQQVITDTLAASDDWLAAACEAKGLTPGTTEAGEELFSGIGTFVRMARLLRDALRDIRPLAGGFRRCRYGLFATTSSGAPSGRPSSSARPR
jgi:acyl-CoA reductase-like NAD-dependent aldehyde dehydrogenase